ncbi:MAG: DUF975 family protein [Ruminococcaceae bacterium]|nr:DUF975 family protein [Oscillospiraceae bacterium]
MHFESSATVCQRANAAWEKDAGQNRRVVLLYALPALVLPILVTAINLILEGQLANTGGLSDIGIRSTLQTVQTVLNFTIRVFLPFWQLGLLYNAMQISRGLSAQPKNLLEGFRRWGAALRLMLLRTLRYMAAMFVGVFLGSLIYTATPLSNSFVNTITQITQDPTFANATAEEIMAVQLDRLSFWDIGLFYGLCVLGAAVFTIPVFYRYRMSDYALLDSEKPGAFQALHESTFLMQGNRMSLLKLDLHLWWYYLLLFVSTFVSYADLLFPAAGIALPFSEEWALMIFTLFSAILQFILYYLFRGQVETVYACVYDALKKPEGGDQTR